LLKPLFSITTMRDRERQNRKKPVNKRPEKESQGKKRINSQRRFQKTIDLTVADWEQTFHAIPDIIAVIDDHHRIIKANKAMADKLGVKPEDLIGKRCHEIIHGTKEPPANCPHVKAASTGREHIEEFFEENLKGYYLFSATPLFDKEGKLRAILEVARDITQRKRAEDALREREELFRSVTQSATDAIISVDKNENIMLWNTAAEELFGFPSAEVIGMPITTIIPDRFKQAHKKGIKKFSPLVKPKKLGKKYEIMALKKDGSEFPVEISLASWKKKKDTYHTGIIRDITKRKKMEEKLRSVSITDALTGLFNRRGFLTFSKKQLEIAKRNKRDFSILYVDLNDMKTINDAFGHKEGDQALIETANILSKTFRASDIIARIGGDEFTVLITEPKSPDIERAVIEHIENNLLVHNEKSKRGYNLSMSMGIAHFNPENPSSIDELIARADELMYENKKGHQLYKEPVSLSRKIKIEKRTSDRFVSKNHHAAELVVSEDVSIKNISIEGMCLKTSQELPRHSIYRIKIPCPGSKVIVPTGRVVWSSPRVKYTKNDNNPLHFEAGLKFLELNRNLKNSLEKFIANFSV
jgi:diguanylate cyclase (GGDEF)-like protein/PAS domain S-box-containing protein